MIMSRKTLNNETQKNNAKYNSNKQKVTYQNATLKNETQHNAAEQNDNLKKDTQ